MPPSSEIEFSEGPIGPPAQAWESRTRYLLHLLAVLQSTRHLELQAELHLDGLSVGKHRILGWAATYPDSTATELSKGVMIDRTTLTRVLDQLERQGCVKRTRSTRDRREVRISVTDGGRSLVQASALATDRVTERYIGALTVEQTAKMTAVLLALLCASTLDRPTLRKLTGATIEP